MQRIAEIYVSTVMDGTFFLFPLKLGFKESKKKGE